MPTVLISDKMSPLAQKTFEEKGVKVDFKPGLTPEELSKIIGRYDGLAIRSSTRLTQEIIDHAENLKVVGRAGIGVDNIDIPASTKSGIVVMNTPFGNSVTTAEHAIAMMMAVARRIPQASASTHDGKWEKSKFMGVELFNKTLGVIGCGNIGAIAANRALGLKMKVIAFDPFLTEERAAELGVEKVELDDLLSRADFITLHTPLTDQTRGILNKESLAKTKQGVRIINCARGGLIVEEDLKEALDSGHVAGAAIDVYSEEPAKENVLFGHENVVCTPHLGASTSEAQVNVAVQVAEQMADYLLNGAVTNAINMPSISAEDAPRLKPYTELARKLGAFSGQIADKTVDAIDIEYQGQASSLNTKPLTSIIVAEILTPMLEAVNMVSAPAIAKERGIKISESLTDDAGALQTAIKITATVDGKDRSITGTLFAGQPRTINIEGVPVEATLSDNMLFIRNLDKPGLIGGVGTILGNADCNIADFRLGRKEEKEAAIALISIDKEASDTVLRSLKELPQIKQVHKLNFAA